MSTRRCLGWVLAAAVGPLCAQELDNQTPAAPPLIVEVDAPATPVYVQQRVPLVVRVGYDAAFCREFAIPLFQQRLDQPFLIVLPWLQGREDRAVALREGPPDGVRIAVGDRVQRFAPAGERTQDGRRYTLLELRADWLPLAAGEQAIEPIELRYAFASRFEEHLLRGRQPLDRQDAEVRSALRVLQVRELPAAGRPAGFQGAVGEFTVVARASVAAVPVGGTFTLELEIAGAGNLDRVPPLPWPELPGFVVQGLVEQRTPAARIGRFDVLAVREGATAVPPVPFVFFAPADGAYRTVQTAPVPLRVDAAASPLPPRVAALVAADAARRAAAAALPWWYYAAGGVVAMALVAVLTRTLTRRRRRGARLQALARLARELTAAGVDVAAVAQAFASFLAACNLGAVSPPDLPAALRDRVHSLREALGAARYGGVAPAAGDVLAVARDLVRALV